MLGMPDQNILQPRVKISRNLFSRLNAARADLWSRRSLRVASCPLFFSLEMSSDVLLRRAFIVSASVMAARRCVSTLAEILQHGSRIGAALAQHLFHLRQIVSNKIQDQA
jgi:hypothetical protein